MGSRRASKRPTPHQIKRLERYLWRLCRQFSVHHRSEIRWAEALEAIAQVDEEGTLWIGPAFWALGERGRKMALCHEVLHWMMWDLAHGREDEEHDVIEKLEPLLVRIMPRLLL